MAHIADLVAGSQDTIKVRCVDQQYDFANKTFSIVPIDLDLYSVVRLRYSINGETPVEKVMVADTDQVTNRGFASYRFGAADLTWVANKNEVEMVAEVELEDGATAVNITPDTVSFKLRKQVGA
jgi:hypothetical protein